MKKIGLLFLSLIMLFSCGEKQHPTNYISISGQLENTNDSILYISGFSVKKEIKLNPDGSFSDSLKVAKEDFYTMYAPMSGRAYIYLDNGYDLKLTGDSNDFYKSFQYEGNSLGAQSNNFLISHFNFGQKVGSASTYFAMEKEEFLQTIATLRTEATDITTRYPDASPDLMKKILDQNESFFSGMEKNYDRAHQAAIQQEKALAKLGKGKPAPEFNDYEDYLGGTKSLKDFRGNYVYIDIWATWCRPCLAQIPYLKKLEHDFKGKNISFVSVSTDDARRSQGSWDKARSKWKNMVKAREMSGIQLWAGEDEQRFSMDYMANTIPRFILIDPEGNMVNHNEMRPSSPNIKEYLTSVGVK